MCLGIPGRVVELFREGDLCMGKVAFGGIVKNVCLEHVPEATSWGTTCWSTSASLWLAFDEEEASRVSSPCWKRSPVATRWRRREVSR